MGQHAGVSVGLQFIGGVEYGEGALEHIRAPAAFSAVMFGLVAVDPRLPR